MRQSFFVEMADYIGLKAVIPPVITGLYTRIPDVEFSPLLIRTKARINVQVHLGANADYTHPYHPSPGWWRSSVSGGVSVSQGLVYE